MVPENRSIESLHPTVMKMAEKLIAECENQGLKFGLGETYRSVERQDYLYSLGRTIPGNIVTYAKGSSYSSYHQWRVALDFFQNVPGDLYPEWFMTKVGEIAESIGFEWGGRWAGFVDKPHLQYTGGLTLDDFRNGKTLPDPVVASWKLEGLNFLKEKGVPLNYEQWEKDIDDDVKSWAVFTFIKKIYLSIYEMKYKKPISVTIPEVDNYKMEGLEFFKAIGIWIEYDQWEERLDEDMPVWAVLTMLKEAHLNLVAEEEESYKYDGMEYFDGIDLKIDYDYWKTKIDDPMPVWALTIMLKNMYDI